MPQYNRREFISDAAVKLSNQPLDQWLGKALPTAAPMRDAGVAGPCPWDKDGYVLHPDLVSCNVLNTKIALRAEQYLLAEKLKAQGREIIMTDVGDPHALGAKPITFTRQVMALLCAPFLLDDPRTSSSGLFPEDVIERARILHAWFGGGIGVYSAPQGVAGIRSEVADFIERRDGHRPDPEHIFLTDGASAALRMTLSALLRDSGDAMLVPLPTYPIYSALCSLQGSKLLLYELDEARNWALDVDSLRQQICDARRQGLCVRAVVIINPGNPTGQCLSADSIAALVKLCYKERVVLIADEVYQALTYQDDRPFTSVHKVVRDMGEPYSSRVELFSFHTVSKGVAGECGLRGGYMHLTNIHPGTLEQFYKLSVVNMCPNSVGQVAVSCMVNPPKPGDASYKVYQQETAGQLASLRRRAKLVTSTLQGLPGISCCTAQGAMYAFPQLHLPPKAVEEASAAGRAPDAHYCFQLLEDAGVAAVPGSAFGQAAGTAHLRTTILPQEEVMPTFLSKLRTFHLNFMSRYA